MNIKGFRGFLSALVLVVAILVNMFLPQLAFAEVGGGGGAGGGGHHCYSLPDCTFCVIYGDDGGIAGWVTDCEGGVAIV